MLKSPNTYIRSYLFDVLAITCYKAREKHEISDDVGLYSKIKGTCLFFKHSISQKNISLSGSSSGFLQEFMFS